MSGSGRFEDLCRETYGDVVRLAYVITGDRQEALDVAQEAWARAFERWRRVSRLDRPEAWVQRVAVNLAISWRRRAKLALPQASPPDGIVHSPEVSDPTVTAALRTLTAAQRQVIVLRFLLDWSVEEVADALKKRPGTVRALTAQGMERLRRTIRAKGVSG